MTRVVGPESNSRFVYRTLGSTILTAAGASVVVYAEETGGTLADILTEVGAAIPGSVVTVNAYSQLPLFQFPDGVSTVFVEVAGGPRTAVYNSTVFGAGTGGGLTLLDDDIVVDFSTDAVARTSTTTPIDFNPDYTDFTGVEDYFEYDPTAPGPLIRRMLVKTAGFYYVTAEIDFNGGAGQTYGQINLDLIPAAGGSGSTVDSFRTPGVGNTLFSQLLTIRADTLVGCNIRANGGAQNYFVTMRLRKVAEV